MNQTQTYASQNIAPAAKELTIETLQVEIKVIRVGGHKMTLAVFEQITAFNIEDLLENDDETYWHGGILRMLDDGEIQVLGYVNRKLRLNRKHLLIIKQGDLYRVSPRLYDWMDGRHKMNNIRAFDAVCAGFSQIFIAT